MSQSGDSPQPGLVDAFFSAFGTWPRSAAELLDFTAFQAQCAADWHEADAADFAATVAEYSGLADPAHGDSCRTADALGADAFGADPFGADPLGADAFATDAFATDPFGADAFNDLNPFRRRQAQFVDRALYFERVIAWAQASKAEVLADAWQYTSSTAETGRPLPRPGREHDWDATFAAQQGLIAEMACALRIPAGTAAGLLQESRTLVEDRPRTLDALRSGEISLRHARRLLDQLGSVPAPFQTDLEGVLLPHAKRLTAAQFDGKARKLREHIHPESIAVRRARCLADRTIRFYPDKDGMATLWLRAAGDDLQGIYARVTDTALSLQGPDEPRTLSQLRTDVAIDLLASGVTATGLGAGISATVNVTVPVLTLMGQSEEPGELEGYGPIDPETARKLAGTATSFLRILTHPHTGIVLDVSATPFRVPAALKKYLRLRDGTCRFPGCNRAARNCDLDHTRDKQFGGPTTATNLAHLCPADHNRKHFSGWTVIGSPDGTLTWASPAGKHYATDPATRIRPKPPHTEPPPAARAPSAAPIIGPVPLPHDPWAPTRAPDTTPDTTLDWTATPHNNDDTSPPPF
jgi:hypothetical protein